MEKCMEHHIKCLKQNRPRRFEFLEDNVCKITKESTFEEFVNIVDYVKDMFENEPEELDTFFYMVWRKVSRWF